MTKKEEEMRCKDVILHKRIFLKETSIEIAEVHKSILLSRARIMT